MQNNNKILTENEPKNSKARIKANGKYLKNNYKRINIAVRPEQAEAIRETAKQFDISIAQLIINSVNEYKTKHGADTDGETAEKPQEENEIENEIETGENQAAGAEETAGEEEPQEDEDEDEKPEDIPAFVWEQIQRLKKADKRHTAERKAREAAERKRRRIEGMED